MPEKDKIIDAIYEAGAMPELWPEVLDMLAALVGARGGLILYARPGGQQKRAASAAIEPLFDDFAAEGWTERNSRLDRYLERPPYAGFLTDGDLHSEEELRTLPIYADFLNPRGAGAGAATLIQGAMDDMLALTIEAFPDHASARASLRILDEMRPHLGRAATLSGRLAMEQTHAAVRALELIGTPAAMVDRNGRLLSANALFEQALGKSLLDMPTRLKLRDDRSDARLAEAIEQLRSRSQGSSIAVSLGGSARAAMHVVPVRGAARDVFVAASALVVLADPAGSRVPGRDLLQALFDLTPTEARLARHIARGSGISAVAEEAGLSRETIRTHLKAIFRKTNTRRQSELALLLPQYSLPEPAGPGEPS